MMQALHGTPFPAIFIMVFCLSTSMVALGEPNKEEKSAEEKKSAEKFSEEALKDKTQKPSSAKKKRGKRTIVTESEDEPSTALRANKKFMITTSLLGYDYSGKPLETSAGYFMNPDIVLGVRHQRIFSPLSPISFTDHPFFEASSIAFFGKKFFGNSFNVSGGVFYGTVEKNSFVYESPAGTKECQNYLCESKLRYSEIRSFLAIGNQWQWEYFTLGCDWLGLNSPPIYQIVSKNEVRKVGKLTGEDLGESSAEKPPIDKRMTGRMLVLYMGVSF